MEIDRDHAVPAPGADNGPVTEAGWRAMLEAVQGYLCIADAERHIQIINRPTVGREMGQFIGRDFADFVAPEQRAIIEDAARLILSGSGPLEVETQGGESGINLYGITQSPAAVHPRFRANLDGVASFWFSSSCALPSSRPITRSYCVRNSRIFSQCPESPLAAARQ